MAVEGDEPEGEGNRVFPLAAKHGNAASISASRDWRSLAREVIMDVLLGGDGSAVSSSGEKVPLGQSG